MNSKIEMDSKTGRKSLIVFYEPNKFDAAINQALNDHGFNHGEIEVVIALPSTERERVK